MSTFTVKRHLFDKPYLDVVVPGEFNQRNDIVDILFFHHNGVDLHRDLVFQQQPERFHHGFKLIAPGDQLKAVFIQRIEA